MRKTIMQPYPSDVEIFNFLRSKATVCEIIGFLVKLKYDFYTIKTAVLTAKYRNYGIFVLKNNAWQFILSLILYNYEIADVAQW